MRFRAAIAAAVVLAPALAAVSVAGVLLQRHELTGGVELIARERARAVADELATSTLAEAVSGPTAGGEGALVEVLDDRGRLLAAADEGAAGPFDDPGTDSVRRAGLVVGEEDDYLVVGQDAGSDRVLAAQSLEAVDAATSSATVLLAVGDPALVLLVAALTYLLAGRALRPVESLRAQAARITAADLTARLPEIATGDEVDRLGRTLNEMLSRLESSADAQRRFVADASHELRSPIATIRTLHEVAADVDRRPDWPEVSREVLVEVHRLEQLVADLLLLARSTPAPVTADRRVELTALVGEEGARSRRLPVSVHLAEGVVVHGSRDGLGRAVRNLLDNAERHARTSVSLALTTDGATAVVTVSDDGDGIARADRERVFERFVRLDEARSRDAGGTGLGLSISRHVLRDHGGDLIVVDGPGVTGAVFVASLPLR